VITREKEKRLIESIPDDTSKGHAIDIDSCSAPWIVVTELCGCCAAKRVPGDEARMFGKIESAFAFEHADHRHARRHDRGLRIFGQLELVLWPFAHQPEQILSERLVYETPGSFAPGKNYIEFTSPEECLNGAVRLIEDVALRQQLMRSNAAYYRDYLRPDALVRNALKIAIEKGAQG